MYSEKRLNELPIPVIPNNEENNSSLVSSSDRGTENEADPNDTNHSTSDSNRANDFIEPNLVDALAIESTENVDPVVSSTVEDLLQPTHEVFLPTTEFDDSGLSQTPNPIEIKEEPELHLDVEDQNHIDFILMDGDEQCSSEDDESDDEPVLIDGDNLDKFPMPIAATMIGLTKRENDPISGSLAFNEKVNSSFKLLCKK